MDAAFDMIGEGAKILHGIGGTTGSCGIMYGATPKGKVFTSPAGVAITKAQDIAWGIGVDTDEYEANFKGKDRAPYLLTSALKKVDVAVAMGINNFLSKKDRGKNTVLDASLDGISIAPCHEACKAAGGPVTPEMVKAADDAKEALKKNGKLTGVTYKTGACNTDGKAQGMCASGKKDKSSDGKATTGGCANTLPDGTKTPGWCPGTAYGCPAPAAAPAKGDEIAPAKSEATNQQPAIAIAAVAAIGAAVGFSV